MTIFRQLPHSDPINLSDWWENEIIRPSDVTVSIRDEFEHSPPYLSLPAIWAPDQDGMGGPAVTDPAMLHMCVSLGTDEDGVTYQLSLAELVAEEIDSQTSTNGNYQPSELFRKLADRLRELAGWIETGKAGK